MPTLRPKTHVYLPPDLGFKLSQSAERHTRSLSQEATHILRDHFAFTAQVKEMGIKRKPRLIASGDPFGTKP